MLIAKYTIAILAASASAACVVRAQDGANAIFSLDNGDGQVVSFSNMPIWYDAHDGALMEDATCFYKSRVVVMGSDIEKSAIGSKFVDTIHGKGQIGPLPKYTITSGRGILRKLGDGSRAIEIVEVSAYHEKAADPVARLKKANEQMGCAKR